jgi:hypothetical protein
LPLRKKALRGERQAKAGSFFQNIISGHKKSPTGLDFRKSVLLLRGFFTRQRPASPDSTAVPGKKALKTQHYFALWLISVVSNKSLALWWTLTSAAPTANYPKSSAHWK